MIGNNNKKGYIILYIYNYLVLLPSLLSIDILIMDKVKIITNSIFINDNTHKNTESIHNIYLYLFFLYLFF